MSCWYESVCKLRGLGCDSTCARHGQMAHLFANSRIPKAMQRPIALNPDVEDEGAFDRLIAIRDSIVSFVSQGKSLYITSRTTGNGKTSWAVKLMMAYFDRVWPGNNFRVRGVFVGMPELLAMYSRIHSDDASSDEIAELTELIETVDLVIWDDIGATELTKAQQNYIQGLLDKRLNAGLANIYTGNMRDGALASAVGQRIYSRVATGSETIVLYGRDMRGTVAGNQ